MGDTTQIDRSIKTASNEPPPASITDDLKAGDTLILLTRLPAAAFVPKKPDGTPKSVSWAFRARDKGLEVCLTPSGWGTTKGAFIRFLANLTAKGRKAKTTNTDAETVVAA